VIFEAGTVRVGAEPLAEAIDPWSTSRARAVLAIVAAGFVAVGLSACGGKSSQTTSTTSTATSTAGTTTAEPPVHPRVLDKAGYTRTMRGLGKALARSVEGMYPIADSGPGAGNADALAKVERAKAGVETVRTSLRGIIAPADVQADHAQLIQAVGVLETELDQLVVVLQHPLTKPLGSYFKFAALQRVSTAVADIRTKGYAIG
jgi:hypothetical protein